MTCIVGIQLKDKAIIGGDSCVSTGGNYERHLSAENKVFARDRFIFGGSGTVRQRQLLKYSDTPDNWNFDTRPDNIDQFMHTDFIYWARKIFKDGGLLEINNNVESFGGSFLIACFGYLFKVASGFSVTHYVDGIYALGCGSEFAYGAMYASKNKSPKKRLLAGLEAAEKYSAYIGSPFYFVESCKENK